HPQRKRSRVPKRRRFRHSAPRLSSISDAWGRLNVVTPFHHLSGDSHLHRSLGAGPITASSSPHTCSVVSNVCCDVSALTGAALRLSPARLPPPTPAIACTS